MKPTRLNALILIFCALLFVGFKTAYAQTLEEKEWIHKGNLYYAQNEFDKARVEYSKVLTTEPTSYIANFNLGNTFFELENYPNAVMHFQKAVENTNEKIEKANAYHNLGNSLMMQNSYEKAIEAYKNSLRNNPKDDETRYNFVLAKELLEIQEKQQNPPNLPRPSDFAKEMKARADHKSENAEFEDALNLMREALKQDSTVKHFQTYMDKLQEIVILDTMKLK